MKIINITRKTILTEDFVEPKSLHKQSLGLLAHNNPVAMLLKTRFGIHTLFMKYPIDVLVLNRTTHVVAMKENLKPNDYFVWNIKYNKVLELPAGTIKKTKTQINDLIDFN